MADHPESLDHMLAAWNERDPSAVRAHLDRALSADVHFVDPDNDVRGIDAFEVMVKALRARMPEIVCSRASAVDHHHDLYRYHWAIHQDEKLLIAGFDVAEIDGAGRVERVLGFFGPLPFNDS